MHRAAASINKQNNNNKKTPNGATEKSNEGLEGRGEGREGEIEKEDEAYLERLDEVRLAVEQDRALVGADVDVARV